MGSKRLNRLLEWFPAFVRYMGLGGVVFVTVVWLLANRIEPLLLGLFGSMIGLGEVGDAVKGLVQGKGDRDK